MNSKKSNKTDIDINKKRGLRLKQCREAKKLSQQKFAEIVNCSTNYISMLERGERPIDWDKAHEYAKQLEVSPDFLMCKTDIAKGYSKYIPVDLNTYGVIDLAFLQFLLAAGHSLSFNVVRLRGEPFKEKTVKFCENKHTVIDWGKMEEVVSLDQLKDICLSNPRCILQEGEAFSEVIIRGVTLNNNRLSYGEFVYTINRLYDYINFTLESIERFRSDYKMQMAGNDASECELIETFRDPLTDISTLLSQDGIIAVTKTNWGK